MDAQKNMDIAELYGLKQDPLSDSGIPAQL